MEVNQAASSWFQPIARSQGPARMMPRPQTPPAAAGRPDRVSISQAEGRGQQAQVPNFGAWGAQSTAPHVPLRYQPDNAQSLRASRVPAELSNHPGGPPAAPEDNFRPNELDRNGRPITGRAVFNRVGRTPEGASRHHYVQIGALEPGLTREQAIRVANGFNAPTAGAMQGYPNSQSARRGFVDPSAPAGGGYTDGIPSLMGGHVSMNRGTMPNGLPWAINSTTPGLHPLNGHITRSLLEHEGRYYIRTEGIGTGNQPYSTAQDVFNGIVGPATFDSLNEAGNRWARWEFGLGTRSQAIRDRALEGWQGIVRRVVPG